MQLGLVENLYNTVISDFQEKQLPTLETLFITQNSVINQNSQTRPFVSSRSGDIFTLISTGKEKRESRV